MSQNHTGEKRLIQGPTLLVLCAALLGGCANPMGADIASTRTTYNQVDTNPLNEGKITSDTIALLDRYDLDRLAAKNPVAALMKLHEKALATGERDLLFALADLSYVAGNFVHGTGRRFDRPDPRDYYLGSAVYAYLFLFGDARGPVPTAFDRRFRIACEL